MDDPPYTKFPAVHIGDHLLDSIIPFFLDLPLVRDSCPARIGLGGLEDMHMRLREEHRSCISISAPFFANFQAQLDSHLSFLLYPRLRSRRRWFCI